MEYEREFVIGGEIIPMPEHYTFYRPGLQLVRGGQKQTLSIKKAILIAASGQVIGVGALDPCPIISFDKTSITFRSVVFYTEETGFEGPNAIKERSRIATFKVQLNGQIQVN